MSIGERNKEEKNPKTLVLIFILKSNALPWWTHIIMFNKENNILSNIENPPKNEMNNMKCVFI